MRREGAEPPEFTRMAYSRVPRCTLADWRQAGWLPGAGSLGQGTAAIGPVAAGRLAQTPSACIPRPRLPSTTPNNSPWLPRQHRGGRLMRPLGHVRRPVFGRTTRSHRPEDGQRFVRSTTRCSLKRTLNHGEEAAEHLRERSSSAKRDRLLWGKTGRSMMGLSSGDEDGNVGSPEQTLSLF
jgi:hypothetical protein